MISIRALSTSAQQVWDYYGNAFELSQSKYYIDGSPCYWAGEGAVALGLSGEVLRDPFISILEGSHPFTGEQLVGSGRHERRPGWDVCANAKKDLSVSFGFAREFDPVVKQALYSVHHGGCSDVRDAMESFCGYTRRGKRGIDVEPVSKLVFACFDHCRARPTERSGTGDMHLHTHMLAVNLGQRSDGTWGTIESKPLYEAQKRLTAIYRAGIRRRLSDLGIETRRAPDGTFVIAHVPDAVVKEFSSRREAIEREMASSRTSGAQAAEDANLKTRLSKSRMSVNPQAENRAWVMRALALGFDPEAFIARLRQNIEAHALRKPSHVISTEIETRSIVRASGTAWTRGELDRLSARLVAKARASSPLPAQDSDQRARGVAQGLIDSGRLVPVATSASGEALYADRSALRATRKLSVLVMKHHQSALGKRFGVSNRHARRTLKPESELRTAADELRRVFAFAREQNLSSREMRRHEKAAAKRAGIRLTDAQQAAARVLIERSRSRIRVLAGDSGTGKTVTLRAAATAYAEAGYRVIGIGKTGPVARELSAKACIHESMTYAQYRAYVGENWVAKLAREQKNFGRALVGKPVRRLPKLFDEKTVVIIDAAHNFTAAELRKLLGDAKRSLVLVSGSLSEPQSAAFARLAKYCKSTILVDRLRGFGKASAPKPSRVYAAEPMSAMLERWTEREARDPTGAAMIVPFKRHADDLNRAAQQIRIDQGFVKGGRSGTSSPGIRFCKGDRVTFTKTSKLIGVLNGQTGDISFVMPALLPGSRETLFVKLDDGNRVIVPLSRFDSVDLGYATTRARADSIELERAYVLDAPGSRLDRMGKWAEKVILFSAEQVQSTDGLANKQAASHAQEHEGRGACR